MKGIRTVFTLLALASLGFAQSQLDDAGLTAWKTGNTDFICFDIRGDAVIESVAYPCFRSFSPEKQIPLLGCTPRILIYCHAGIAAQAAAESVIATGYPADSVFYAGFDSLPGSRYPAGDTLPLAFLNTVDTLPQDLSAYQLRALMVSRNPVRFIDIRSTGEIAASGMIEGACNIVWTDPFQTSLDRFNHTENIVLNCASGYRAGLARTFMLNNGFDAVRVVNFGGFSKYANAGVGPVAAAPNEDCNCSGIGNAFIAGNDAQQLDVSLFPTVITKNGHAAIAGTGVQNMTWRIYDMRGNPLTPAGHGSGINVNGLNTGTYVVRVEDMGGAAAYLTFIVL